jgi:hypothetical protein
VNSINTFVTSKAHFISGQVLRFSGGDNGIYVDPKIGDRVLELGLDNLFRGSLSLSNCSGETHLRLLDGR